MLYVESFAMLLLSNELTRSGLRYFCDSTIVHPSDLTYTFSIASENIVIHTVSADRLRRSTDSLMLRVSESLLATILTSTEGGSFRSKESFNSEAGLSDQVPTVSLMALGMECTWPWALTLSADMNRMVKRSRYRVPIRHALALSTC